MYQHWQLFEKEVQPFALHGLMNKDRLKFLENCVFIDESGLYLNMRAVGELKTQ